MILSRFPDRIAYGSRRELQSGFTRLVRRADGSIASANQEHAGAGVRSFDLQQAIQGETDFQSVQAFHLNARGMGREFRFKDHADYQAVGEEIMISGGGPVYYLSKAYWLSSDPPGVDIVNLNNFTASGAIGTAAATVDVGSLIKINQTSVGITLTLPAPTDTTAGRMIQIANYGVVPFSMMGLQVEPRTQRYALWNGSAWSFTSTVETLYVVYRRIRKPVNGTVTVYLNSLPITTISSALIAANALHLGIGYELGNIQLANESVSGTGVSAALNYESGELIWLVEQRPRPGIDVLTASFEFDIPARFNSDRMPTTFATFRGFQNSFAVIEQVNPEDIFVVTPQSYNSLATSPTLTDLTFTDNSNLTNSGTTWSNVSGGDGYGLGDLSLAVDGWVQMAVGADSANCALGLNVQQIKDKYTGGVSGSNGYEYGVLDTGSGIQAITNGVASSTNGPGTWSRSIGDLIRIRRTAGYLFIEISEDSGSTWALMHSFATPYNGELYVNINTVGAASKGYAPKIT